MADIKPSLEGVDTSAADRESAIELSGATPAETPAPGTPNRNGTTMELEKTQLTQADLMATRPNGGWKAWLQVACGFSLMFNTYGLINTFGIYQDYYTDHLHFSPSRASLIGGIQTFLLFFATAFAGPLYDAGYTRLLVAAGAVLIVFGTMMQSLCSEYWQFILAESLLIGFGGGLTSFLSPTVLSTYFTTLYPLAQGIAASGAGIGGIILPIVYRELEPKIGFPWTVRVIGFILLATLLLPVLFLRPRMIPGASRKAIDTTAFTDWPFVVFLCGNFIYLLGSFTPFFYVEVYAVQTGIANADLGFYIISIMNAGSALGRILPNFLSSHVGPLNMLIVSSVSTFVFAFAFEGTRNVASLIVVSAFYGGVTGLFFALQPVVVIGLCPDPKLIGTRVGMAFCFSSFAVLASNPIAGAIQSTGGFSGVWLWSGVTTAVGTGIMFIARVMKTKSTSFFKKV
ncbi:major facilitator superfamily domain-containing protein [Trichoderma evansii]